MCKLHGMCYMLNSEPCFCSYFVSLILSIAASTMFAAYQQLNLCLRMFFKVYSGLAWGLLGVCLGFLQAWLITEDFATEGPARSRLPEFLVTLCHLRHWYNLPAPSKLCSQFSHFEFVPKLRISQVMAIETEIYIFIFFLTTGFQEGDAGGLLVEHHSNLRPICKNHARSAQVILRNVELWVGPKIAYP